MSDQSQQMQQALDLIKNGQRDEARALLEPIVRANPDDANAWWLMAMAVSTPADMQNALRNVVRINPSYPNAQAMLDQMGGQLGVTTPSTPTPPTSTGSATEILSPTNPMAATMVNTGPKSGSELKVTPPSGTPVAKPPANDDPFALPDNFNPGVTPPNSAKSANTLDDIFEPPTPLPNRTAPKPAGANFDDMFAASARPAPNPSMQTTMPAQPAPATWQQTAPPPPPLQGGYVPPYPPMYGGQPQQQQPRKRGGAMRTFIIILLVITVCVCGVCVGVPLIGSVVVMNNPTLQAAAKTVGAVVGTGVTFIQAPDRMPTDGVNKGTLTAGKPQSEALGMLEKHIWQYQGKSGENVTISAKAQVDTLQVFMGLYDSNGNLLKRSSGVADRSSTLTYPLPGDGTYSILVAGLGGSSGAYTVQLTSGSGQ